MSVRLQIWSQSNQEEERHCASCGTSIQATRSSNQRWSLEPLLPATMNAGADLCPACRQIRMARRIDAIVSART
jgi:hypothetical protein